MRLQECGREKYWQFLCEKEENAMVIIYLLVLCVGVFCVIRSRGQPEKYLYKRILLWKRRGFRSSICDNATVMCDFKTLFPFERPQEKIAEYYMQKIRRFFLLIMVGSVISVVVVICGYMDEELVDGYSLKRAAFGQGSRELTIEPVWENENESLGAYHDPLSIQVEAQRYNIAQLDELYGEMTERLMEVVKAENESLSHASKDLCFPKRLEGYPYAITWETSNYRVLQENGCLGEAIDENGEVVTITAEFSYFDDRRYLEFAAVVFPRERTWKENAEGLIRERLEWMDEQSRYEPIYRLPDNVNGQQVSWKKEKEKMDRVLFLLFGFAAVVLYFAKDRELHQEIEKRQQELLCDYPFIISKITLFIGAGLTVRAALHKVTKDYHEKVEATKERHYAYEELSFACYEMDNGVSEAVAYEHFGRRCGQPCYSKLASLLSQNSKKGNGTILISLQHEAEKAQEERRNLARKLGEEAGTKLLFPMVLLLIMVMLMILIPAMLSFAI